MTLLKNLSLVALILLTAFACKDEEMNPTDKDLSLNIQGLEDLGSGYAYEGWIMVDGAPKTTGTFTVDASGNLSQTTFAIDAEDLEKATAFILTIEPSPDNDPAPSDVHILAGDFSSDDAALTIGDARALGNDFTTSSGNYILATPTNGAGTDENSGVWWLDPAAGPEAGLDLPTLPAGWQYEGWAVINGVPVTTGKFTDVSKEDDSAPFSGSMAGPPFPGEDFLENAPAGMTFPVDLSEMVVVISVEPQPDNSANPFLLKPLVGAVPANAADHTVFNMDNNATGSNPTGTASK
jgi:hypothetical protein